MGGDLEAHVPGDLLESKMDAFKVKLKSSGQIPSRSASSISVFVAALSEIPNNSSMCRA